MLLEVRNLTKTFKTSDGDIPVLSGINLDLEAGETLALTGESGSGKSTLLHLVGGLDVSECGSIVLDGQDLTKLDDKGRSKVRRETVGIIFQQFNLIPSMDVASNIAFQARLSGEIDQSTIESLSERLGIKNDWPKSWGIAFISEAGSCSEQSGDLCASVALAAQSSATFHAFGWFGSGNCSLVGCSGGQFTGKGEL